MAAAAATNYARTAGRGQVHPAPQLTENNSDISAEQLAAMRAAEDEAGDLEAERTMAVYEEKVFKAGRITKKPRFVIDPRTSSFIPWWDAIGMIALLFTAIVTFVEVSFVDGAGCLDELFVVNRFVDCIFICDGLLQFFLMFPQAPQSATDTVRWVHDYDKIAHNYITTWFFPDFFSIGVSAFDFLTLHQPWLWCGPESEALALQQLTSGSASNLGSLKVLRIIRVARLVKLIRLVRSARIVKRFESRTAINYGYLSLFKCLVGLMISSHWFACIWGLITTFEGDSTYDKTWYVVFNYCQFDNTTASMAWHARREALTYNASWDTWLQEQVGSDRYYVCVGPTEKYVASLYWAIMTITSIGYGDIAAPEGNTFEQVVGAILMLLGGMIWGTVIATFCGVITNLDPAGNEFRTTMDNLNRFMSQQGLPQEMRQQLREYFFQTRHLQIARANKLLIENMSPMLQGLVVWKVNEKWLRHVWFLRSAEDAFMVQLSLHLTAAVFAPAELCPQGYMYIIHRGIALYGGKVLTSGKVWGEDMILQSAHLRSKFAARCMTYVEVYMIGRDDLLALAIRYPATLKIIRRSAFRLGFRREMIRRAEDSIKRSNEAAGIKTKENISDKMLTAVSSRKLDDEQKKQEEAGREALNNAFDSATSGEALPPIEVAVAPAAGGGDGVGSAEVAAMIAESEKRLMGKLEAIAASLAQSSGS